MSSTPLPEQFARLISVHEDVLTHEHELRERVCQIGRSSTCHVLINPEVKTVSRIHAEIRRVGLRYMLHDTGSANGTFVNLQRVVEPYVLKHQDRIGLGGMTPLFEFLDDDPTFRLARPLSFNDRTQQFCYNNQPLDLTPSQFRLLNHLYQNANELCTYASCAEAIWGSSYEPGQDADALHRVVTMLRKRLREVDPGVDWIQTRRELGYQLDC